MLMPKTRRSLTLIGAGDHALSVLAAMPEGMQADSFVDPSDEAVVEGLQRLGDDDEFLSRFSPDERDVLITLVGTRNGSLAARRRLIGRYAAYASPTVVAPTANVDPRASIGPGTVVMHGAIVNTLAGIGAHSVINTGAIVEHHVEIGENVFVGPGAVLCGRVRVGSDAFIGAGAVINPGLSICGGAVIGAGSVVTRDITEPGTYAGVPARKLG